MFLTLTFVLTLTSVIFPPPVSKVTFVQPFLLLVFSTSTTLLLLYCCSFSLVLTEHLHSPMSLGSRTLTVIPQTRRSFSLSRITLQMHCNLPPSYCSPWITRYSSLRYGVLKRHTP